MTSKPPSSSSSSKSAVHPGVDRLRTVLPQLVPAVITQRNRAYAAPVATLPEGRLLVWQDSGPFHPAGELRCQLVPFKVLVAADNLSLLEPRLRGFESFVPSEACTMLVEHALAPVLGVIEQLAGQALLCEEFQREASQAEEASFVRVGFVLLDAASLQPQVRGRLSAPVAFWQSLEFTRTPALPETRYQQVPLQLSVRLGSCRLPAAELGLLAAGDALRITPRVVRQNDNSVLPVQVVHGSGQFSFRARLAGDQLTFESAMNTMNPAAASSSSSSSSSPSSSSLSGVDCELSFELGTLRMSLADIAKLRVGQALRLGSHLQDQPVRILTGGRQIGRGELAAVGDELVVVVTETGGLPPV